jgi:Flp pilus assembly protein TadD
MTRLLAGLLFAFALHAQTARDLKFERSAPPLPDKRSRWALVIGVSAYKYAPPAAQLRFAHRDAEEFAAFLRSPEGGAIPGDHVRLLTDSTATLANVRASLHTWLSQSAGPNDIVYLFFAGHAVVAERGESYFVAHDSDPQNLHATSVSFEEVNNTLTNKIRAATVVLLADACHAGGIGWTSDPSVPSTAQKSFDALGAKDRAFLKLLASRPSERSYEDERWGGGHGVFTYSILTALRGAGERDRDGFVRVSELIDYVSRAVPEQTASMQNPRIAGNFEGALPMAALAVGQRPVTIEATGPQSAAASAAATESGLEEAGQECISDYVQSTTTALKQPMFVRAAEAFAKLRTLRPGHRTLEARQYFCQARAQIAGADFARAIDSLNRSLEIDPDFACSYNALGVSLARLGRLKEARSAFERAAELTPAWALPPLQIAQQLIAAGELREAVPYLEKAAKLNPRAIGIAWSLARIYRLLGRGQDFLRAAYTTLSIDRNYAPIYSELGMYYESVREPAKAAQAFDNYLTLAPNFADSLEIRRRTQQNRAASQPKPPTLRRESDPKRSRE